MYFLRNQKANFNEILIVVVPNKKEENPLKF